MDGTEGRRGIVKKISRKNLIRLLIAAITLLVLLVCVVSFSKDVRVPTWSDIFGIRSADAEADFVRFIDVGQGDSILIQSNGYSAMIDFGNDLDDGAELTSRLRKYGVRRLDCMIITHYDADHIGGADSVLEQLRVENIILPVRGNESSNAIREVDSAVEQSHAAVYEAQVGTVINIGDFELTIVAHYEDEADTNERSIIVMAELDGVKFLFTGDADSGVEKQMMKDGLLLDCDVFKAAHHGSKNSNSFEFLESITPTYAVISCGELNSYGHPHSEVLESFNKLDVEVFRTDTDGDITFYVENKNLRVATQFS